MIFTSFPWDILDIDMYILNSKSADSPIQYIGAKWRYKPISVLFWENLHITVVPPVKIFITKSFVMLRKVKNRACVSNSPLFNYKYCAKGSQGCSLINLERMAEQNYEISSKSKQYNYAFLKLIHTKPAEIVFLPNFTHLKLCRGKFSHF